MSLANELDELLAFDSSEAQWEHEAQMLAFQFLGRIDKAMADKKMSKKELASRVGTSASFITQVFRGDRKPSWTMLVKMAGALGIRYVVGTQEELDTNRQQDLEDSPRSAPIRVARKRKERSLNGWFLGSH